MEISDLTKRERDIATLLLCALPNKEIAQELRISLKTVKFHLKNMCLKAGLRHTSRVKLAMYLYQLRPNLPEKP